MNKSPENTVNTNNSNEVSASHFALQLALQTMKERCSFFQKRLSAVEEENLRLRIENQNISRQKVERVPASEISTLNEKLTLLSRQKVHLIETITMITKENNQLWARLSHVKEENQSLGSHLSKISNTLMKHPLNKDDFVQSDVPDLNLSNEGDKAESLEEISLKLIDTIRLEKRVLEKQCEEMTKLQTDGIIVEECGFTLNCDSEVKDNDGAENVMENDLRLLKEKMDEQQKLIRDQQAGLRAAIESFNLFLAEKKTCKCKQNQTEKATGKPEDLMTLTLTSENIQQLKDDAKPSLNEPAHMPKEGINNAVNNVNEYNYTEDRICPLCSKFYSREVPFEEFHYHVLSHFGNEDNDSIVPNFEVIS